MNTSGTIAVALAPIPKITNFGIIGGDVALSGTNGPSSATYWVLTSTDLSLPLASWTRNVTNTLDASCDVSSTNGAPVNAHRCYTVIVL